MGGVRVTQTRLEEQMCFFKHSGQVAHDMCCHCDAVWRRILDSGRFRAEAASENMARFRKAHSSGWFRAWLGLESYQRGGSEKAECAKPSHNTNEKAGSMDGACSQNGEASAT